tara:strand:- start:57 stop:965 length:909 start_codon:yes stop_codon:yes gene_type:complete
MDLKSKIILISGPTASGKSNIAIKFAKKVSGEIVNADSMQIYKELKILTARPKKKDQQNIKHHLYGFQNVKKNFSTGHWLKLVIKKIKEIQTRNKIPILVGGTGLYFKALTEGLVKIPQIPIKVRNQARNFQKKIGQQKFFQKLIKLDPLSKDKINPNDVQRSIRAYEIKKFTRVSIFVWFNKTKIILNNNNFVKIYIDFERSDLIKNINFRVEKMFKEGAVKEVKSFLKLKVPKNNSANKVIGIKEISNYINNKSNLAEAKELIAIKTRQYAKRQTTWARGQMTNWQKIDPNNLNTVIKKL